MESKKFLSQSDEDENENSSSNDLIFQDKSLNNLNIFPFQQYYDFQLENKEEKQEIISSINQENSESNIKKANAHPDWKKRIRSKTKRRRRENNDNIRKRIKRYFFNKILINNMNNQLNKGGSRKYFSLFPNKLVSDVHRKRNKNILNKTILQIIKDEEFYESDSYKNYLHNKNVIDSLKYNENKMLEKILNTKYSELYEEYINSENFEKDLKKLKDENETYIERYEYLSKTWLEYFLN